MDTEPSSQAIQSMQLPRFDMGKLDERGDTILIFGRRGMGKTSLVKDVLSQQQFNAYECGMVFSYIEPVTGEYSTSPRFSGASLYEQYREDRIGLLINSQNHRLEKGEKRPAYLVLDNCFMDDSWLKDANMRNVFYNGRCSKILTIITLPRPCHIPKGILGNIDWIFMFAEPNLSFRKQQYEWYAQDHFSTFEIFCQVMDSLEPYECLVLSHIHSQRVENKVYWYKATLEGLADYK